jgi:hypothetical protein
MVTYFYFQPFFKVQENAFDDWEEAISNSFKMRGWALEVDALNNIEGAEVVDGRGGYIEVRYDTDKDNSEMMQEWGAERCGNKLFLGRVNGIIHGRWAMFDEDTWADVQGVYETMLEGAS